MIDIYAKGSAINSSKNGAYGIVLVSKTHNLKKEFSRGFRKTNSVRMDLMAISEGLKLVKVNNATINIYSNSKYYIDVINQKLERYFNNGYLNSIDSMLHADLLIEILNQKQRNTINFIWIAAKENNNYHKLAYQLSRNAIASNNLEIDCNYEDIYIDR